MPARRVCLALSLGVLLPGPLGAVEKVGKLVPPFDVTDKYVTAPTMLVRAGADGRLREVWSGMDAARGRTIPLFLETLVYGEVRRGAAWRDLRTLGYHNAGTRPGYVRMVSDDGAVTIEITSRRLVPASPIFVRYSFSSPVDLRLIGRFKMPGLTRAFQADDGAGADEFATEWRSDNGSLATTDGPKLVLATLPRGATKSIDRGGFVKEFGAVREVLLCLDATDRAPNRLPGRSYVEAWTGLLGGGRDPPGQVAAGRVSFSSGNPRLDRLFADSIDAVRSHQFASGVIVSDLFFYRDSWIRDGAYTSIALALAGYNGAAERFYDFWNSRRGFSVGGEREAQQPAIGITGIWFCSRLRADRDAFLRKMWPYVSHFCDYYVGRISREGMLNVAEEWICFIPSPAAWPNAEIYSGLRAGAKIARELGHPAEAARWDASARRLQRIFAATAYDAPKERIIPMAGPPGTWFRDPEFPRAESRNGPLRDDRVDSGMLIIGRMEAFGRGQAVVEVDDPHYASTRAEIERDLENPDHSIFRFGPNPTSPHAPEGELDTWPIAGAWAAQDEWLLGRTDLAWRYLLSGILNKRRYDADAACDYLPENWDRSGGVDKPLLMWSHGEFVTSVLLLSLGLDLEADGADLGIAPSLPPGSDRVDVRNFRFRGWRLDFALERRGTRVAVKIRASRREADAGSSLRLRLPFGRIVSLASDGETECTVDPGRYYLAFGHSGHAAQRARIVSRILLGRNPPRDPAAMSPQELEDFLVKTETDYRPSNE